MKIVYSLIILAIILVLGYLFVLPSPETMDKTTEGINVARINQELSANQAVLLDVRTAQEREDDGYASGSTHFDLARLEAGELPNITKGVQIYTYCKGGVRAEKARSILGENDYTNVTNIGGLVDWINAGGSIVK